MKRKHLLIAFFVFIACVGCQNQESKSPDYQGHELKSTDVNRPIGLVINGTISFAYSEEMARIAFLSTFKEYGKYYEKGMLNLETIYFSTTELDIEDKPYYLEGTGNYLKEGKKINFRGAIPLSLEGEFLYLGTYDSRLKAEPIPGHRCEGDKCGKCDFDRDPEYGFIIGCKPCPPSHCQQTGECFCNHIQEEL